MVLLWIRVAVMAFQIVLFDDCPRQFHLSSQNCFYYRPVAAGRKEEKEKTEIHLKTTGSEELHEPAVH